MQSVTPILSIAVMLQSTSALPPIPSPPRPDNPMIAAALAEASSCLDQQDRAHQRIYLKAIAFMAIPDPKTTSTEITRHQLLQKMAQDLSGMQSCLMELSSKLRVVSHSKNDSLSEKHWQDLFYFNYSQKAQFEQRFILSAR